jgi:acetyl esterase/lipase
MSETGKKEFTYDELKELVGERQAEKAWRGLDRLKDQLKPHQIEIARTLVTGGSAGAKSAAALPALTKFLLAKPRAKTQFLSWLDAEELKARAI